MTEWQEIPIENIKNNKPPFLMLFVYRFISVILLIIAILTFFTALYKFYQVVSYLPFVFLSFAFFGFFFSYGLWMYRRWIIIPLVLNLASVIVINFLKLSLVWDFSSRGILTTFISIALATGLLTLVYFTRHFLVGEYIKSKILTIFVFFWLVSLLNYSSFIKNLLKCCS